MSAPADPHPLSDGLSSESLSTSGVDYLIEQRQWLESVLDLLPAPMLLIEPARAKVTFSNQAAKSTASLFAAVQDQPAPRDYLCDADGNRLDPSQGPIARLARGERLRSLELQWCRPDGTRSLIVNADYLPAMHGHERVAVLLYQDITQQKQVEDDLRRANQGKDALLAMLGHELRNPLAAITSAAELIELLDPTDADFSRAREVLSTQIQHLVRLVDDMLDVSRLSSGKIRLCRETLDLRDVLQLSVQACQAVIEARRHELTIELPTEPMLVEGDSARLEQVFVNLLVNAAKYTDEGGRIAIVGELTAERAITRIRDNGIGITPELLPQIFELFRQLKPSLHRAEGGLGIGLSVVKNLVELHGGSVAAYSEGLNRGSEFIVRLPRSTKSAVVSTDGPSGELVADKYSSPLKVLVVEDNPDIAHTLVALIRHLGHTVQLASDGFSALAMARDWSPDAAFVDIGLPTMSGLDLARAFRSDDRLASVFLVALTGFGQAEDRRRSLEAGFDEHLVKPLNFSHLQQALARVPRR